MTTSVRSASLHEGVDRKYMDGFIIIRGSEAVERKRERKREREKKREKKDTPKEIKIVYIRVAFLTQ
jgi:hypothetical protein